MHSNSATERQSPSSARVLEVLLREAWEATTRTTLRQIETAAQLLVRWVSLRPDGIVHLLAGPAAWALWCSGTPPEHHILRPLRFRLG